MPPGNVDVKKLNSQWIAEILAVIIVEGIVPVNKL
jgi:hypothetical protein